MQKYKRLSEAFQNRRFDKGEINFSKHTINDPHIKKAVAEIAKALKISEGEVLADIHKKIAKFSDVAAKAPILYGTILQNIVENESFDLMEKHKVNVANAPQFSVTVFKELFDHIRVEHKKFMPMKSFMHYKRLQRPVPILIKADGTAIGASGAKLERNYKDITTAAASPHGDFMFNIAFMQKLIDWAYLKELKPKSKKYECNGGEFPDAYCYVEFVIIHEFMHYTEDDFHYQKVIPNADPEIINWVGDFRTNYLLVKSGYEQLPMGLFNDDINYDRQERYVDMYKIVEDEFKKLSKEQQDKVKQKLDEMGDNHKPGQEEGGEMEEGKDGNTDPSEIDKRGKKTQDDMSEHEDIDKTEAEERQQSDKKTKNAQDGNNFGTNKSSRGGDDDDIDDYKKIKEPTNWRSLIEKFIGTPDSYVEDSWAKPKWGVTMGDTSMPISGKAREMTLDLHKVKLAFVVDSSGSMLGVIAKVYAFIFALLKNNVKLKDVVFTLIKFSNHYKIYKGIFSTNRAVELKDVDERYSNMPLNLDTVFKKAEGSATQFSKDLADHLEKLLTSGYNIIIFSDSDIHGGSNLANLKYLFQLKSRGKIFVIMDNKSNYIELRKLLGFATDQMSYVESE